MILSSQNRLWVWLTHSHPLPFHPILFRQSFFFPLKLIVQVMHEYILVSNGVDQTKNS